MYNSDIRQVRATVDHFYGPNGFLKNSWGPYVNESFWGSNYNLDPRSISHPPRMSDPEATMPLERGKRIFTIPDSLWPDYEFHPTSPTKAEDSGTPLLGSPNSSMLKFSSSRLVRCRAKGLCHPRTHRLFQTEALPEDIFPARTLRKNKLASLSISLDATGSGSAGGGDGGEAGGTDNQILSRRRATSVTPRLTTPSSVSRHPMVALTPIPGVANFTNSSTASVKKHNRQLKDTWRIADDFGNVQKCMDTVCTGILKASHGTQTTLTGALPVDRKLAALEHRPATVLSTTS